MTYPLNYCKECGRLLYPSDKSKRLCSQCKYDVRNEALKKKINRLKKELKKGGIMSEITDRDREEVKNLFNESAYICECTDELACSSCLRFERSLFEALANAKQEERDYWFKKAMELQDRLKGESDE